MNILGWPLLIEVISNSNSTSIGWSSAYLTISTFIYALGGWSLALTLFLGYIGSRIADKMKISWSAEANKNLQKLKAEENEKLEKLRAEINQEQSVFRIILDSYSKEFQCTQPNRIKAIETLWEKTLFIRVKGGVPIAFYGLILEKEFNSEKDNYRKFRNEILGSLSLDDVNRQIIPCINEIEKCRPFLGEYLWTLFKTYGILISRTIILLNDGRSKNDIICWHKDEYTRSIINEVFSEDEQRYIYSMKIDSFKAATEILERKILYEIAKIVSGELAADNNFEKAVKIQKLLDEGNKETKII